MSGSGVDERGRVLRDPAFFGLSENLGGRVRGEKITVFYNISCFFLLVFDFISD